MIVLLAGNRVFADFRQVGLIPGLGRSPGVGNGNPLQYSCLGNFMDRGAWQAMVAKKVRQDLATKQQTTKTVYGIHKASRTQIPHSSLLSGHDLKFNKHCL